MTDAMNDILRDDSLTLFIFTMGYLTYFFSRDSRLVQKLAGRLGDTHRRKVYGIYLPRLLGFCLLGVVPWGLSVLVYASPPAQYGLSLPRGEHALLVSLGSIAIFALACSLRSGKRIDQSIYPQVKLSDWTIKDHLLNALTWSLYLLGYEFMLRGLLFFSCLAAFGLVPAIAINSTVYSLIHIFKGRQEAFGAFFLGIVLCLVAYYTNSFVIALVLHVILAVSNDLKAIRIKQSQSAV